MRKTDVFIIFFIISLCFTAADPEMSKTDIVIGSRIVSAEIAWTAAEKNTGLMHRTSLETDSGMLFVYETEKYLSFWMKNTLIPLSIAFIDKDGIIRQIEDMSPGDLTPLKSRVKCRYALEMTQGWFKNNKITAGTRVIINV